MENASKALLIAAAVLVVIILVAVGMKIYSSTTGAQKVAADTGKTISDKTGDASALAIEETTGKKTNKNIKYFSNTTLQEIKQDELSIKDKIKIENEEFKVFSITSDKIKAIAYNNIELSTENSRQSSSAGVCAFSERPYWSRDDKGNTIPGWNKNAENFRMNIDMKDSNIQKYIIAYQNTLRKYGAASIEVRAPQFKELNDITSDLRNPTYNSVYWVGSVITNDETFVVYARMGELLATSFNAHDAGVRPIIIIPK